jgi:hypothetical protein
MAAAVVPTRTDSEVASLCRQAFEAEHNSKYKEAFDFHCQAIQALNKMADDAKFLDRERKRIARKQAKFHGTRRELLQQILSGQKKGLDVVLPSSISARESLAMTLNGLPCLSLDELLLSKSLKVVYDETQKALPKGVFMPQKIIVQNILNAVKDVPAFITPETKHMFKTNDDGSHFIPFYTPTLDKSKPPVVFHVYISSENVFTSGRWYYFKVKDSEERQPAQRQS